MNKFFASFLVCGSIALLPAAPTHAGIVKKMFVVGSVIVGGVALSKAQASNHCSANPSDAQCEKHVKGTDADPAIVAPKPSGADTSATPTQPAQPGVADAPKPARDANTMIDAGAAKAKEAATKFSGWLAKKKAEHDAKKAGAESTSDKPAVVVPTPGQ